MNGQRIVSVVGVVLLFGLTTQAMANGVVRDGVGAVSTGRGGTNIAHSDNGAILLDNPAGMMGVAGRGLVDISFDGLITNLHYEDPFTADTAPIRPVALPEFGLIHKSDDGNWAFGLGVAAPAGFGAHFNLSDPVFGPNNKYSSFGALVKILPAVACQVTDRLAVGGTLGVGVSRATIHGPYWIQTGMFQGAPTVVDIKATGATFIWSVGAQYDLSERTKLGVTYQSESRVTLDGNAEVSVLPLGGASEFDASMDITWPRTVGLGITHQLNCCHRFSSDLIWVNWHDSFDSFGLNLSNPSNPGLLPVPTLGDQYPLDWKNSMSFRFGYEYFPTECSVWRAGYVYNIDQMPNETLSPFIPAILEHAFAFGWGHTRGDHSLDIAYQYSFGPKRAVGTSGIVGGDFSSSEHRSEAHWLSIALTKRF